MKVVISEVDKDVLSVTEWELREMGMIYTVKSV